MYKEWRAYSKKAKRLFPDALRLRVKTDFSPEKCASRIQGLEKRFVDLALLESTDADVRPAVIMRKVMQGNRTDRGERTHAVFDVYLSHPYASFLHIKFTKKIKK